MTASIRSSITPTITPSIPSSGVVFVAPIHKWVMDEATGNFIDTGSRASADATRDGTVAMITPGLDGQSRSPSFTPDSGANSGDILLTEMMSKDAQFSIKAAIKFDALPAAYAQILGRHDDFTAFGNGYTFLARTNGDFDVIYYWAVPTGGFRGIRVPGMLTAGQEDRIAVSYDGSIDTGDGLDRVKIYNNGVLQTGSIAFQSGTLQDTLRQNTARYAAGCMINSADARKSGIDGQIASHEFYDYIIDEQQA